MYSGLLLRSHKPGISLGRALFFAITLHLALFLTTVVFDFIPPFKSKMIRIRVNGVGSMAITMGGEKAAEPKGVERKIAVENPSPPKPVAQATPKVEQKPLAKPVVTPKPIEKKPAPEKPKPMPPAKTIKKPAKTAKETLATPTPKAEEKPAKEKEPEKKEKKEEKKLSPPDLGEAPALNDLPKIEAKGKEKGGAPLPGPGLSGGLPSIGGEEGIELPGFYLADARNRIAGNFSYPSYYRNQLKTPVYCLVGFRVMLDGTISDIQIEQSSGDPALDNYATRALELTASLLPLRDYIKQDIGKNYLGASVPFVFGDTAQ